MKPTERINNKEEYHQPGDIEVSYNKNDNLNKITNEKQNTRNKNNSSNPKDTENENLNENYSQQKKITEFFVKEIRRECEQIEENIAVDNEIEEPLSTQEMITDARERRTLKMNGKDQSFKCEQCPFTTTSISHMKKHKENIHKEKDIEIEMRPRYNCDKCAFKTTSECVLQKHMSMHHDKIKKVKMFKVVLKS